MSERLSVNINDPCAEFVRDQLSKGIMVTETVRRAISVLRWIYQELNAGNKILVMKRDGNLMEMTFTWN